MTHKPSFRLSEQILRSFGIEETPVYEHQFHPQRKWRFDIAFPVAMIALEIEGLTGGLGGRHQRFSGYASDCEKYSEAAIYGWCVLRMPRRNAERGDCYKLLSRAFQVRLGKTERQRCVWE